MFMRRAARAIVFKDNQLLVIKRNKFGKEYFTLPGGGVDLGEVPEQTVRREIYEETSVQLGSIRLVFQEEAGDPYGTQYIYLADYAAGEPALSPKAEEAFINELGQNMHEPMWLPIDKLASTPFVSEGLKHAILEGLKHGFPDRVRLLSQNTYV